MRNAARCCLVVMGVCSSAIARADDRAPNASDLGSAVTYVTSSNSPRQAFQSPVKLREAGDALSVDMEIGLEWTRAARPITTDKDFGARFAVTGTIDPRPRSWRGGSDGVTDEGPAPAFDLPRVGMDGERVSLGDFAGRPVVVNFWASWCVPCRQEMPALQATSERLAGRVAFVGINYEDTESSAADFQRDVGAKYPSGLDSDGEVASRYAVQGLPTTVLIDGRGRIVARVLGGVTQKKLLSLVDKAFGPDVSGAG